ncbi:MAG: hypothetical protein HYZ47_05440, partial [Simkania negevensis]|nr:hypothetical protein [Simkania negevensis]
MRLIRFVLLLSLIPNLLYAFKQHAGEGIYNHSLNQCKAANGHIGEANKCDPSQRKEAIYFLQKAVACYRHAIADIDLLLKKIKEHKREKADWHKPLKKRSKEHRLSCIAQVEALEGPLRSLIASEQEEELFKKVQSLYEEGIAKKEKARAKEIETPRRLNNTKEVVSHLKEAMQLYEEALVSIRAAAQLLASSSREEDKAALKQVIQNIEEAANRCKQAAIEWPHIVDSQRGELKKRIAALREETEVLQKKELKRASFEVQKQIVPLLEQLIESDVEHAKEASEELAELQNQISLFKKEADAKHFTATFPSLSREEFEQREKERRKLFFANKALLLRPDLFLAKMLHNRSYPLVLPLDGQMSKQGDKTAKDLTLFTGQFYRFLLQNNSPISHLFIKVHKHGEVIHEEQITLPIKNTSSWEHYLRTDQTLIIPETKLKTEFGLDLRLNFVLDPSCPFTLIIAQKGSYTDYQFSFSLKENNTETLLYSSHFIPPPPWQLAMLRKPLLLNRSKPLLQVSYNTSFFIKEKQDPLPKYQEAISFPVLDQFVEKLHKDPLAITQYVHNEIELVDPFLHQEGEVLQAPRIFRNPYTTFLEKRGSAWEQCMLLVYLLRQAGYQAVYAYDKPSLLPKAFVEKLLLTKLPNKEEVLLNYPWVLFFNGEEWISLFPWMKEMQVNEGYDLYHFMPEEYANADRWLARYLQGDENILKHIGPEGNDTVGLLFVRFVEEELRKQGLSLADVGIHCRQLKKQCASWSDFPRPSVQGEPQVLKQLDKEKKLFADVEIEIFSHQNPHKKIQINPYFVDLNLTTLFLQFSPDGASNHRLYLREMNLQGKGEEKFLSLDPTDLTIGVKVTHCPFLEQGKDKGRPLSKQTYPFFIEKGTYAALCVSFGAANTKTTSYFYEKLAHEKEEDRHLHALLSLVGAAYFEKCNQIQQALASLHKIASPFFLGFALAKLSPDLTEDPLKKIPHLKFPQLDMLFNAHKQDLSSSYDVCTYDISLRQFQTLAIADASSNEHQILREVFQDPCPISTVKLLQLAHLKHQKEEGLGAGFLAFNRFNFACAENTPDRAQSLYFSHLKDL